MLIIQAIYLFLLDLIVCMPIGRIYGICWTSDGRCRLYGGDRRFMWWRWRWLCLINEWWNWFIRCNIGCNRRLWHLLYGRRWMYCAGGCEMSLIVGGQTWGSLKKWRSSSIVRRICRDYAGENFLEFSVSYNNTTRSINLNNLLIELTYHNYHPSFVAVSQISARLIWILTESTTTRGCSSLVCSDHLSVDFVWRLRRASSRSVRFHALFHVVHNLLE